MEQKIIQVGNSLAVTLPAHFVKGRGIKPGQKIFVDTDIDSDLIQMSTIKKSISTITPEFKEWLERFNKKYKNSLAELATK